MSFFDDGLTDDDMKFLEQWERMGKSETADSEYEGHQQPEEASPGEGDAGPSEGEGEVGIELDSDSENGGVEGESDTMSLDGATDFVEGETETRKTDIEDEPADPEYSDSNLEDDGIDPEAYGGDEDPDGGFDEGDGSQETHFDPDELEATGVDQVEVDGNEGERGNSDEARESDEPLELDGLPESEPSAEAEHDSNSMDAQAELDDHFRENEEAEPEQKVGKPDEGQENAFESVPAPGEACTNHCEDNPTDDHDGECPHCNSRIEKERELWGAIASDSNGVDIYPGDKIRVVVPMAFTVEGAILTANVPNQGIDPIRVAEQTNGKVDETVCWLSGRISEFTGWHMKDAGNSVWTFAKGKKIMFAEKIGGQQGHSEHGNNGDEGDLPDIEDFIKDLEDLSEFDQPEEVEAEIPEPEGDFDIPEQREDEPDDEFEKRRDSRSLTKGQRERFENLHERIVKKIRETFGGTLESIKINPEFDGDDEFIHAAIKIVSRGTTMYFDMTMRRFDENADAPENDDTEEAA